jgi:hypothetical protein
LNTRFNHGWANNPRSTNDSRDLVDGAVNMTMRIRGVRLLLPTGITLTLALGMIAAGTAYAAGPAPVNLGTAASYAVLAGTPSVTNTGSSFVGGDLGIHPAASVTGFPPGNVSGSIHAGDAVALQAKNDLNAAYGDAASRTPATAVVGGTLGGQTLVGGIYTSNGVTLDLTGTLTLDGQNDPNSVWIFKATSDLITASSSVVSFINGAQPCNVFWQVTSSATLGSGSNFVGTIMALTSITLASAVTVNGRVLARNGKVTLINDNIAPSTCAAVAPTPSPTASASPSSAASPSASPSSAASPSSTPAASAAATTSAAPTARPTARATATPPRTRPATFVPLVTPPPTDALPTGEGGGPLLPLTSLLLFLAGAGLLSLALRLRRA